MAPFFLFEIKVNKLMLKKHETTLNILQQLLDIIIILGCWLISYIFRFDILPEGQQGLEELFLKLSPVLVIVTLFYFHQNGLYKSQRFSSRYKEIGSLLKANTLSVLVFIILLYFFAQNRVSRIAIATYFASSSVLLLALRISIRNFLRQLRRKGKNLRHILLVGNGRQVSEYILSVRSYKDAGINFVGWIDSAGKHDEFNILNIDLSLKEAREKYSPDTIIIGYSGADYKKTDDLIKESYNNVISLQILPDLSFSFVGHQIEDFAGIPILTVNQPKLSAVDLAIKRSFDFLSTLIGLLIISPILLTLALLVKLTSSGPIFYGQERMGLDGKSFKMWKFRSMKIGAEDGTGAVWATQNDDRRTSIGTFLRSTSLDELPQLWNVLVGDMSLVGPRPERPVFVEKFKDNIPAYMLRHKVKTGITGWAQVNGWRGDTSLEKRIECDIFYIKNWSIWFDIKILILTFFKGFINKNAY